MSYIHGRSKPQLIPALQTQIADLVQERASLRRTIEALASQVRDLNATPVNSRRAAAVCGTYSGYQKHIRDKSTPCYPCKAARAKYTREYRATKNV